MNYAREVLEKELDQHRKLRLDYINGKVKNEAYHKKIMRRIEDINSTISLIIESYKK